MEINKIYNENCIDTMSRMTDGFICLTVTSPPYDGLRTYTGEMVYNKDVWQSIIKELYRVTKKGGVVVWIVGDATIQGSETGTSFKQALYAMESGFNLHDTMIYEKDNFQKPNHNRYWACFEYMFIFSKDVKPATANMIKDRLNSKRGEKVQSKTIRNADGTTEKRKPFVISEYGKRKNVWSYSCGYGKGTTDKIAYKHPATFPEQLANDHIISWSNEGELIYDPFMGSGTTAKMAILNKRNYIGSEISKEYCKIADMRINECL